VPRKSGHTCNADLTIIQHGGRCPDLRGLPMHYLLGMRQKRHFHTPMKLSFLNNHVAKRQGHLITALQGYQELYTRFIEPNRRG